jgi:hypothetical protein
LSTAKTITIRTLEEFLQLVEDQGRQVVITPPDKTLFFEDHWSLMVYDGLVEYWSRDESE